MTPEAQRIAIAKACGLHPVDVPFSPNAVQSGHNGHWFTPEAAKHMRLTYPRCATPKIIPDYLNDLNAMFVAWRDGLDEEQQWIFGDELGRIIHRDFPESDIYRCQVLETNANAAQRAEAFLKTIGKWDDAL